jgi:multidrug efflux system membrane fusion protein
MAGRILNATTLVFAAITGLVVVWIGSGMLAREPEAREETDAPRLPTVDTSWSEAEEIVREIVLYGDVQPAQIAILRARVQGIVEEIVPAGTAVAAGDVVGRLSADDRAARVARAEAQVAAAQRDYDAAVELADRDIAPEAEVRTLFAQLEAARAELRAVELELSFTELAAPADGIVNRVIAETGAFVTAGGEVIEIVDNDPLVAVVQVPQASIGVVRRGMPARVRFIGGDEAEGEVSFVSPIADAETRTFRVEVEIANPDGVLPSGLSAEVVIPFGTVAAHRLSPALGRLDSEGRLGVHLVDDDDLIAFAPIEIVRADAGGIWVTGLPERARLVTISHGALADGQAVIAREAPPEAVAEAGAEAAQGAVPEGTARDAVNAAGAADGSD